MGLLTGAAVCVWRSAHGRYDAIVALCWPRSQPPVRTAYGLRFDAECDELELGTIELRREENGATGPSRSLDKRVKAALVGSYEQIHRDRRSTVAVHAAIIPHESLLAKGLTQKFEDLVVVLLLPPFFAFTGMRTQIGLVTGLQD